MIDSDLTEEEKYLFALLMDESGVDHMEFLWADNTGEDNDLFRTWPIQMAWWRTPGQKILSAGSRSIGKSLSILGRSFAFPFVMGGDEMVITAPDGDRLGAITDKVETLFLNNAIAESMLAPGTRGRIKHRPFHISFANGARIMGRIPRLDGTGIQGSVKSGTLILTRDRGFVEVENMTTDDYVWSHKSRWSKVWDVYELPEEPAFEVRGQGAMPLVVNDDHRFYVRNDVSKQPGKTKRKLGEYKWEYVNDLSESTYGGTNAYWTSPANFGDELDIEYPNYSGCKTSYEMNEDFWWIVGRYLADGCLSNSASVVITAPEKKEEELIKRFDSLEINFSKIFKESGAFTYRFNNTGLARWLEEYFGKHSHRKTMPTWVFTMTRESRQALLDGYLSGDGCAFYHGTQNRFTGSSVSKKLTLSIGTLAHTLGYHVGYGYNQPDVTEICGMKLKEKPAVRYLWRLNEKGDGFSDNDKFMNYKIRSVEQVEDCKFYGVSIEDGSYYADGIIHKNTHPIWLEHDEACFSPDALVTTLFGQVPIRDIGVGDMVLGIDGFNRVSAVHNHGFGKMVNIILPSGEEICCTPNHHFYQGDDKWEEAQNLKYVISSLTGEKLSVIVEDHLNLEERFDLTVENNPSYAVENTFVHNSTYPERGWKEIVETVKIQNPKARWRCIAEDQKVFTSDGWKKIQDINIGDLVLTHKNNWKSVLNVWDNGIQECVKVKGNGSPGIIVTENHKFYTREQFRSDDNKNLTDPEWTSVSSFVTTSGSKTHWSSPVYISNNKSTVPLMQKLPKERLMIDDTSNLDWLWLYGLFLAEGYTCDFNHHGHNHRRSHWCVNDSECDYVAEKLKAFGLNPQLYKHEEHSVKVIINSGPIQRWLKENAGSLAHNKFIANWVWDLPEESRQAIFDGMNYGDGSWSEDRRRWEYVTVSSDLAFGIKMLAQSLGYVANVRYYDAHESVIEGRTVASKESWSVQMTHIDDFINPHSVRMENLIWSPIQGPIESFGERHVYDLEVEDDHSYVVEGIVVSNCHGVTMGPGNTFDDKVSGNDPTWIVKKLPAMYRPNWSDKERHDKQIEYGGYESLDYKRNILGSAEGADSSLLVLSRLMANTDIDELSEFNMSEYYNVYVSDALLHEADDILDLVDPPIAHTEYKKVWMGMDYGLTTSLSCILIFTEVQLPGEKFGRLKLVARIMMSKIPTEQQVKVIKHLMFIYRPMAIAFDAHGVGQPAYEWLQKEVREDPTISWMLDRVKGYSFSENIIVDFDEKIDINTNVPDDWERATITRKTSDASLDILRLVVDTNKIWLPYDKELIGELQAIPRKELMTLDEYGKPRRKKGQHMLDALRFVLLAWRQQPIEEVVERYKDSWQPTSMIIMDYL